VARVLHKVAAAARRDRMFEPGSAVLVAVSGGPDSLCLLHSLVRLRRLLRISPVAFHFDHRLREGSELDAVYVRRQAANLGAPFELRTADSKPRRGQSVEAWARAVRYESMAQALEGLGGGVVALGHTADDQAETVLMALVRGGGLESISAMSPVTGSVVRPLLNVTREETVAFCRALGLRPRRDPMNEDPAYLRVALRTRAIPIIEKALGRNVRGTLARTAALLRQDAELLDELARRAELDVLSRSEGGVELRTDPLRRLPAPLASRVVRHALLELGALPETKGVEAVLALASGRPGQEVSLPGGLLARRARGYLRLSRPSPRAMR
jgi:tRNA(Ile)-lysidine synthase